MKLGTHKKVIALALVAGAATLGSGFAEAARVVRVRSAFVISKPRPVVVVRSSRNGVIDVNVKPKATEVWVDGRLRGLAGELDGSPRKLVLRAGTHRIKLVTPDGQVVTRDVLVRGGTEINLGLDLRDA